MSCLYALLQAFGLEVASADGQPGAEGICLTADAMMSILQVGAAGSCMAHMCVYLCVSLSMAGPVHWAGSLMPPLHSCCSMCILMCLQAESVQISIVTHVTDALPQRHGVVMQGSCIAREAMSSAAATLQCAAALPWADAGHLAEAVADGLFGRPGGRWHAAEAGAGTSAHCLCRCSLCRCSQEYKMQSVSKLYGWLLM